MTPDQRTLARHALGLTGGRRMTYRNWTSAARGTFAHDVWNQLVDQGKAEYVGASVRLVHFRLTRAGAEAALNAGETLDPEDFP